MQTPQKKKPTAFTVGPVRNILYYCTTSVSVLDRDALPEEAETVTV